MGIDYLPQPLKLELELTKRLVDDTKPFFRWNNIHLFADKKKLLKPYGIEDLPHKCSVGSILLSRQSANEEPFNGLFLTDSYVGYMLLRPHDGLYLEQVLIEKGVVREIPVLLSRLLVDGACNKFTLRHEAYVREHFEHVYAIDVVRVDHHDTGFSVDNFTDTVQGNIIAKDHPVQQWRAHVQRTQKILLEYSGVGESPGFKALHDFKQKIEK